MKLVRFACRSINTNISHPLCRSIIARYLSESPFSGNEGQNTENNSPPESAEDLERRIFGEISGSSSNSDAFFRKLDRLERGRSRPGGSSNLSGGNGWSFMDGLDESFNSLSDGMDGKLEKAATYFEFDPEEIMKEDYSYRPDVHFKPGTTYELKDLDLRKPGVNKPGKRYEFEVTTEEVLRKADFRNVRFLANFLTPAGIIIKRSKTGISAKAQRKVAREIKTARAFGLMPFTTMGTKSFVFGKTMEALDEDFEYETYDSRMTADADGRDSFVA